MICDNIRISEDGRHLLFAGQDVVELAKKYGTPLYLMDEDKIREKCRLYKNALHKYYGEKARPLYASKANCFKRLYEIMSEEGMGIDVVSAGEIYTALQAGYDIQNAYFHSNNKTDWDILKNWKRAQPSVSSAQAHQSARNARYSVSACCRRWALR